MKTRYFYVYKLERLDGVGDPTAKDEVVVVSDDTAGNNPQFSDADPKQIVNVQELDR